jgi:hypothetical protein
MQVIRHRRNTVAELSETPTHLGVEVDIRSCGDRLLIHHDPFVAGEDFETWMAAYRHRTLILNVKEEGLEDRLLETMRRYNHSDFFFLDQSFPFLIRTANRGERRCAVRVSEFEAVATAFSLAGRIDWIWVDCFTRFPLKEGEARALKECGFKLCLVSPELQGRTAPDEVASLRRLLERDDVTPDAVCTKRPDLWS